MKMPLLMLKTLEMGAIRYEWLNRITSSRSRTLPDFSSR